MRSALSSVPLVLGLAALCAADTVQLPVACKGADTVSATIDRVGDSDRFSLFLAAGDTLTVKSSETGPQFGLFSTLKLADPSGADVTPAVKGQGRQKASFKFTASATGEHVVALSGDPGGFGGATGTYRLTLSVKRAKPSAASFADAAGGTISLGFTAPAGSSLSLSAATKKGGFDLTSLVRPDATPEPGFGAAVVSKARRSAKVSKFPLTGGNGAYEVRGQYDAGSKVTVKVTVATNEGKRARRLTDDEPRLDAGQPVFPSDVIEGTDVRVSGSNLDDIPVLDGAGNVVGRRFPTFVLGGVVVPADSITHPNGAVYRFDVPAGLAAGARYDLEVVNADGQGARATEAVYVVPLAVAGALSVTTAGPAGGRRVRIDGTDMRSIVTATFDTSIAQATTARPTYAEFTAPAHAPGTVSISLKDNFGRTVPVAGAFTYLDIPSNRITTTSPSWIQAVGGQTVTVNGADFGANTVFTVDGADVGATRVSGSVIQFVAPEHADGSMELRVTDDYEQTSALDVDVLGFTDVTVAAIPAPDATANATDGWRATRVLTGDLDGDQDTDLVLLRPETAFGGDVNRSRVRLLLGDGAGAFADATASKFPAVSGDEDWRAKDGVLLDIDGDGDLDLAIITDDTISAGARPSLRVLRNDGTAGFTDYTSTAVPANTAYGDRSQGLAIAAANFDGVNRADLVIVHTGYFHEQIIIPGGPPMPGDPIQPPDTVIDNYFAATRVLTNNGSGVFSRKADALPAVTPAGTNQFQGVAVAVGDVNGQGREDIVITRALPVTDPQSTTNFLLATTLLTNDGSAVFTDVTAAKLPAASDPEYLQGARVQLSNLDGDGDLDLVLVSNSAMVSPVTSEVTTRSATRLFSNDGTGAFTALGASALPAAVDLDVAQGDRVLAADFTGDGKADLFIVSQLAPEFAGRAGRFFVQLGGAWQRGSKGLPSQFAGDDLRGADAAAVDVDGDGDLDIVIVRDEPNDTVRNTLVLKNPR